MSAHHEEMIARLRGRVGRLENAMNAIAENLPCDGGCQDIEIAGHPAQITCGNCNLKKEIREILG